MRILLHNYLINFKKTNNMTPKEKAIILVNRFYNSMEFSTPKRFAKQCALIAVQEIICSNPHSNP